MDKCSAFWHPLLMNLTYSISPDRHTLTIHADEAARAELRSWPESQREADETGGGFGSVLHSDKAMYEAFEGLIANSELEWICPEWHGDLTDAPILGILNPNWSEDTDAFEKRALERWGFMDYALRSPLEDLRDKGEAVFVAP